VPALRGRHAHPRLHRACLCRARQTGKILTHLSACAEGRQGPLAGPSAQPASGVPVAVFSATGPRPIAPQRDPSHPNGLGRRGLPRVAPRQPPWPVRPRRHRCPQRCFALTALPRMWQRTLILGQLPGCPACGRRCPARPKSKFLSLTHSKANSYHLFRWRRVTRPGFWYRNWHSTSCKGTSRRRTPH
jgi:hypothetical protein